MYSRVKGRRRQGSVEGTESTNVRFGRGCCTFALPGEEWTHKKTRTTTREGREERGAGEESGDLEAVRSPRHVPEFLPRIRSRSREQDAKEVNSFPVEGEIRAVEEQAREQRGQNRGGIPPERKMLEKRAQPRRGGTSTVLLASVLPVDVPLEGRVPGCVGKSAYARERIYRA